MKMKNKIIPISIIILIVILAGIWLYPSSDSNDTKSSEVTGAGISAEVEEEETADVEAFVEEDEELDEISGKALIGKCLLECGGDSETDLESDLWKGMCNKKYNQGEDAIRDFIETC